MYIDTQFQKLPWLDVQSKYAKGILATEMGRWGENHCCG